MSATTELELNGFYNIVESMRDAAKRRWDNEERVGKYERSHFLRLPHVPDGCPLCAEGREAEELDANR